MGKTMGSNKIWDFDSTFGNMRKKCLIQMVINQHHETPILLIAEIPKEPPGMCKTLAIVG